MQLKSKFAHIDIPDVWKNQILTIKPWPSELSIKFPKGLVWAMLVLLEIFFLWKIFYRRLFIFEGFTPLQNETIQVFLTILNIIFILYLFVKFGEIQLKKLVFFQLPSNKQLLKWIYLGISVSLFNLFLRFPYGLGAQLPDFIFHQLIALILSVILAPISEEIIFRGVIYGSMRSKYGIKYAFTVSIFLFVMAHSTIQLSILQGAWGDFFHGLIPYTIIAFMLAYIYESTRSLLLCMVFHSAINFIYHITPLIAFFYGGYSVHAP